MKITVCINAHFSSLSAGIVLYWFISVVVISNICSRNFSIRRILVFSCFMYKSALVLECILEVNLLWEKDSQSVGVLTVDLQVPAILHCSEGEMWKLSFTSDDITLILLLGSYPQRAHCHVTIRTGLQSYVDNIRSLDVRYSNHFKSLEISTIQLKSFQIISNETVLSVKLPGVSRLHWWSWLPPSTRTWREEVWPPRPHSGPREAGRLTGTGTLPAGAGRTDRLEIWSTVSTERER